MKKKLFTILLILTLSFSLVQTSDAQGLRGFFKGMFRGIFGGGSVKVAAGGCDPATNEVGDRTDYASAFTMASNTIYCILYTPDCTGTLEYAYIKHQSTSSDNIKMAAFLDDGDSLPNVGDTIIGTWQVVSSSAVEWAISASKLTGSVSTASSYWVCGLVDTTLFDIFRTTSGTRTVYLTSWTYISPPSNLLGSGWSPTASRDYSWYVRIE